MDRTVKIVSMTIIHVSILPMSSATIRIMFGFKSTRPYFNKWMKINPIITLFGKLSLFYKIITALSTSNMVAKLKPKV